MRGCHSDLPIRSDPIRSKPQLTGLHYISISLYHYDGVSIFVHPTWNESLCTSSHPPTSVSYMYPSTPSKTNKDANVTPLHVMESELDTHFINH